jgi:hypothetical protein
MVDRVYKEAIPLFLSQLERMRKDFAALSTTTDWNGLRVEPLLRHTRALEAVLRSRRHAGQVARLRRGVSMFHSDLVYLRQNVQELEKLLQREQRASARRR